MGHMGILLPGGWEACMRHHRLSPWKGGSATESFWPPKTLCQWLLSFCPGVSLLYTRVIALYVHCEVLHADVEMMGYWANEGNMNILNNSLNILSKGAEDNLIKNEVEILKK